MRQAENVVFRDVIALALAGFVALVILMLPHINPPDQGKVGETPPGNVIVELVWKDGADIDVDLWVKAPTDFPVGYSNLNGRVFNLLRDDLGLASDALAANYENAYTRGIIPGTYTVNAHMFSNRTKGWPVSVTAAVSVRPENQTTKHLLKTQATLLFDGQEITLFRFVLDREGNLLPGSVDNFYVPLRSGEKQ